MKHRNDSGQKAFGAGVVLAMLFGLAASATAQVVILSNGNEIRGTEIRAQRNGDIILTTPQGQRTFARGTYTKAVAPRPPAFDQARQLVGQNKHDEAIAVLERVVNEYRYLDWDNSALMAIGQLQTTLGNHDGAVEVYERLQRQSPELRDDQAVQWAYRSALLQAGQYDRLRTMLDPIIQSGPRPDAARAQVMRGDILLAQGQVENATMDYLRSAILFESETSVHPEAVLKAGLALERLRDPRAKDMFRRVVERYPQSPQAQEARSRM